MPRIPNRPTQIICVMGPANAGKSTLIHKIRSDFPADSQSLRFGFVEVGRELREKYSPAHFKGLNNPAHTAEEAIQLCFTRIREHIDKDYDFIVIDGQPRSVDQVRRLCSQSDYDIHFLMLDASLETREQRAYARHAAGSEALELSLARLKNDMQSNYTVLTELIALNRNVYVFSTDAGLNYRSILKWIISSRGAQP